MVQSKVVKTSLIALELVLTVVLYGITNSVLQCLNIQFQFDMRINMFAAYTMDASAKRMKVRPTVTS